MRLALIAGLWLLAARRRSIKGSDGPRTSPAAPPASLAAGADRSAWTGARWETYKIVIAAFYALCLQRVAETAITSFKASSPRIAVYRGDLVVEVSQQQGVLLCQLLAFIVWLGLYYINNVRHYFTIPASAPRRRLLAHLTLTACLVQFYFLGATIGQPGVAQLLLILSICAIDACYPLVLGPVLDRRSNREWLVRGVLQIAGIASILLFVSPDSYSDLVWSVVWLALMLLQLLVFAPLDRRRARALEAV